MIEVDMTSGVTVAGYDGLVDSLQTSFLHHCNTHRADIGLPPLTSDQQVKLFGRVYGLHN